MYYIVFHKFGQAIFNVCGDPILGYRQIFATAPAASKYDARTVINLK